MDPHMGVRALTNPDREPRDPDNELGRSLRELRERRGISQIGLASLSGVSRTTLLRWESGDQQPRTAELESVLQSLQATPQQRLHCLLQVQTPQALQALRSEPEGLPDLLHLPSTGDLLRAMRHRLGLPLKIAAERLRIARELLAQWEHSKNLPSVEHLERLFALYLAQPEERLVLKSGLHLTPPVTDLGLHDALGRLVGRAWVGEHRLMDLQFLTLEARSWVRFRSRPDTLSLNFIGEVYVWHAVWLYWRGRFTEAKGYFDRIFDLIPHLEPRSSWLWAPHIYLQLLAETSSRTPPVELLHFAESWKPLTEIDGERSLFRSMLSLCYSRLGDEVSAMRMLDEKVKVVDDPRDPTFIQSNRWERAKVLIALGRPQEAIDYLPHGEQPNVHQDLQEKIKWTEALLAAGNKPEAEIWLNRTLERLERYDLHYPEVARLAARL